MMDIGFEAIVSVPVVVLFTQQIKAMLDVDGRFAFALSIAVGVVLQGVWGWYQWQQGVGSFVVPEVLLAGLMSGLSASGVYSGYTTSSGDSGHGVHGGDGIVDFND